MTDIASNVAVALGLALLELDVASLGTSLVSRPFVVAPLIGWALHDLWSGVFFALVFEALTLEEMPLGGCIYLSATIAAGISTWLAVEGVPMELAFLCGLAAGWIHAGVERRLRGTRVVHVQRVEKALADGREPNFGAEVTAALAVQVVATFVVTFAVFSASLMLLPRGWLLLPQALRDGARMALLAAPWIGAGSLASSLWRRA